MQSNSKTGENQIEMSCRLGKDECCNTSKKKIMG